jgi:phenylalanyl-tRNA synthetase beta chain
VDLPLAEVQRILGVSISAATVTRILKSLEFEVEPIRPRARRRQNRPVHRTGVASSLPVLRVTVPDHRLDIGREVVGRADLIEEIARVFGYERLPGAPIADSLPAQRGNPRFEQEEKARDVLIDLGLQEVVTYRLTRREREALFECGPAPREYITLTNPIAPERSVLRRSLLASLLEVAIHNSVQRDSLQAFEVGPVFLARGEDLPEEAVRLAILMYGPRDALSWESGNREPVDFYDVKGVLEAWAEAMHLPELSFEDESLPGFHPGKCAAILISQKKVGVVGELHPEVIERLGFPFAKVPAAEIDFDALRFFLPERYPVQPVSAFPPVLEDLAVIVPEGTPSKRLVQVIRQAGGDLLQQVRIFDVYRGGQVGEGMKSLALSLVYRAPDRTLTDEEAAQVRQEIILALGQELGAKLRGPTPDRSSPRS